MMDIFYIAGLRGEVIKPADAHIGRAMEHDPLFRGKRWSTNTADQHGRFQQLDLLGSSDISIDLAAANNDSTDDLALNDRLFADNEDTFRNNVTVKMSVDSDSTFEIGVSFEVYVFSHKGILVFLKNGFPFFFYCPYCPYCPT